MKKILYYLFLLFIFVEIVYAEPTKLYDIMKNNAVADNKSSQYVTGNNGIDFSLVSSGTNGMGIYQFSSTANDSYPIYYYRGYLYNNNVLIGNTCWYILRTAENGSIKLLYSGLVNNGVCYNHLQPTIANEPFNEDNTMIGSFGYMYTDNTTYKTINPSNLNNIYFGNDVEYKNGKYTLVDTYYAEKFDNTAKSKYHYTCLSSSITCEKVIYIYSVRDNYTHYYVELSNGEKIEGFVEKHFTKSTNEVDSNVKKIIDKWYEDNFIQYEKYLEDVVYCNDRRVYDLGGWDKDNDLSSSQTSNKATLFLKGYGRQFVGNTKNIDFSCDVNDSFTVSEKNGNGKLKYPIALMTADEVALVSGTYGINGNDRAHSFLVDKNNLWTMTPFDYTGYSFGGTTFYMNTNFGVPNQTSVTNYYGIAPVIALNNDVFVEGNGNPDNPYKIVDMYKVEYLVEDTVLSDYAKKDYYYTGTEISIDYLEIGKEYDGYVFKGWETTDVVVTDNKFLMPDNHVYLVPLLEKIEETTEEVEEDISSDRGMEQEKNPETSDLIIMVFIVFVCSIVFIYSYKYQKEN